MHLHGHVFEIVEIDGKRLERPLAKDMSLVRANGGYAHVALRCRSHRRDVGSCTVTTRST